jgi:predicted  nucleic acid-binding Zn-ribbon protein
MHWIDKAVEELETDLENGIINQEDFRAQMRDLTSEIRDARSQASQEAYDSYY